MSHIRVSQWVRWLDRLLFNAFWTCRKISCRVFCRIQIIDFAQTYKYICIYICLCLYECAIFTHFHIGSLVGCWFCDRFGHVNVIYKTKKGIFRFNERCKATFAGDEPWILKASHCTRVRLYVHLWWNVNCLDLQRCAVYEQLLSFKPPPNGWRTFIRSLLLSADWIISKPRFVWFQERLFFYWMT